MSSNSTRTNLCNADELASTIDLAPRSSLCSSCGICGKEYTSGHILVADAGPEVDAADVDGEGGTEVTGGVCGSSGLTKTTTQTFINFI